jgi:peptide/nickel transport system substrate-binding protein
MWVLSPTQLAKLGDDFASNPICVGPFMYDHRRAGDQLTVIKSPYYYDRKNVYLDKIVYRVLSPSSKAVALKAGDVQAVDSLQTTDLDGVRQSSNLQLMQIAELGWRGIAFNIGNRGGIGDLPYVNVGTAFASSAKLRQAFEEAIDRNALNRVVWGGLYQPTCTMIPPNATSWYEATRVPCAPYDPKHAKALVAASGVPNPTVRLLVVGDTEARLAQFIQAQEAAVGIKVEIDLTDTATREERRKDGDYEAALSGFVTNNPEPDDLMYDFLATEGSRNLSGYSNGRMDFVLANGLKATELRPRSVNYHVAQQIVAADRPIVVLYNRVLFAGVSTSVVGARIARLGLLDLENAWRK